MVPEGEVIVNYSMVRWLAEVYCKKQTMSKKWLRHLGGTWKSKERA